MLAKFCPKRLDLAHGALATIGAMALTMPFTRFPMEQAITCATGGFVYVAIVTLYRARSEKSVSIGDQPNRAIVPLTPRVNVEYEPPESVFLNGYVLHNTTIAQYYPGEPARYKFGIYLTEAQIRGIQAVYGAVPPDRSEP